MIHPWLVTWGCSEFRSEFAVGIAEDIESYEDSGILLDDSAWASCHIAVVVVAVVVIVVVVVLRTDTP